MFSRTADSSDNPANRADFGQIGDPFVQSLAALVGALAPEPLAEHLAPLVASATGARRMALGIVDPDRESIRLLERGDGATGTDHVGDELADERWRPEADWSWANRTLGWDLPEHARHLVIRVDGRTIGTLHVQFPGPPTEEAESRLELIARFVAPVLFNCFAQSKFVRGDRRRDTLVELTRVINSSFELSKVLQLARQVIGTLEGHCVSEIGLLNEGEESFVAYRLHTSTDDGRVVEHPPQTVPIANSAMAHVVAERSTYVSDDLARRQHFPADADVFRLGVRRYVETPLIARGRVLGAFFVGSRDPHRPLRMDLWLYENMALQMALAFDNAIKNDQLQKLTRRLQEENVYLREEITSEHGFSEIVGNSAILHGVLDTVSRVAETDSTVLIYGETGVGKELIARAIHSRSPRADKPMVKVNCAAIPEGMVESELFGHERGAFTSAVERRIGRFELASEGTLFLDEVGELPLAIQAKLLRVLQDGEFERVGGTKTLQTNARIIAATNRDLALSVEAGGFRRDLYYRLNVFPLTIPPLSQRREDIPSLAQLFVDQLNRRMGKKVQSIDRASLEALTVRNWPGNVRELKHVIERAMILSDGPVLVIEGAELGPGPGPGVSPTPAAAALDAGGRIAGPSEAAAGGVATLEEMERRHIVEALEVANGVIEGPGGAAKMLGLKPSTLRFRMKRLGVRRPQRG